MSRTDHSKVVQMAEADTVSQFVSVRVPGLDADPRSRLQCPRALRGLLAAPSCGVAETCEACRARRKAVQIGKASKGKVFVAWQGIKVEALWEDQVWRLTSQWNGRLRAAHSGAVHRRVRRQTSVTLEAQIEASDTEARIVMTDSGHGENGRAAYKEVVRLMSAQRGRRQNRSRS